MQICACWHFCNEFTLFGQQILPFSANYLPRGGAWQWVKIYRSKSKTIAYEENFVINQLFSFKWLEFFKLDYWIIHTNWTYAKILAGKTENESQNNRAMNIPVIFFESISDSNKKSVKIHGKLPTRNRSDRFGKSHHKFARFKMHNLKI